MSWAALHHVDSAACCLPRVSCSAPSRIFCKSCSHRLPDLASCSWAALAVHVYLTTSLEKTRADPLRTVYTYWANAVTSWFVQTRLQNAGEPRTFDSSSTQNLANAFRIFCDLLRHSAFAGERKEKKVMLPARIVERQSFAGPDDAATNDNVTTPIRDELHSSGGM